LFTVATQVVFRLIVGFCRSKLLSLWRFVADPWNLYGGHGKNRTHVQQARPTMILPYHILVVDEHVTKTSDLYYETS